MSRDIFYPETDSMGNQLITQTSRYSVASLPPGAQMTTGRHIENIFVHPQYYAYYQAPFTEDQYPAGSFIAAQSAATPTYYIPYPSRELPQASQPGFNVVHIAQYQRDIETHEEEKNTLSKLKQLHLSLKNQVKQLGEKATKLEQHIKTTEATYQKKIAELEKEVTTLQSQMQKMQHLLTTKSIREAADVTHIPPKKLPPPWIDSLSPEPETPTHSASSSPWSTPNYPSPTTSNTGSPIIQPHHSPTQKTRPLYYLPAFFQSAETTSRDASNNGTPPSRDPWAPVSNSNLGSNSCPP